MKKIFLGVFILTLLILNACSFSEEACTDSLNLSDIQIDVEVVRLEQEIFKLKDKNDIIAILRKICRLCGEIYAKKTPAT